MTNPHNAYRDGRRAFEEGKPVTDNPFYTTGQDELADDFGDGWRDAEAQALSDQSK